MAVVIDEWGSFEGIATIEDVVEAIVGDLRDEFDADVDEPSVRRRGAGTYDVDGSVSLSGLNDELDAGFHSEGFDTIGGLVLERLDRAPEVGDRIEAEGFDVEITRVDGTRIESVRVRERESGEDGEEMGEHDESGDELKD
jgi:CBS domain containing-hemolysin-like protein